MTSSPLTVGVVGAGAWGTALAIHLANLHDNIGLWGRNQSDLALIEQTHKNMRYLPEADIPETIQIIHDLPTLIQRSQHILIVTPSVAIREIFQQKIPMPMASYKVWCGLLKDSIIQLASFCMMWLKKTSPAISKPPRYQALHLQPK